MTTMFAPVLDPPEAAIVDYFAGVDASVLAAKNWVPTTGGAAAAAIAIDLQRAKMTSGATGGYVQPDKVFLKANTPVVANAEMLVKLELGSATTKERYLAFGLRLGTVDAIDPAVDGYFVLVNLFGASAIAMDLKKAVGGVQSTLGGSGGVLASVAAAAGAMYFIKFRTLGAQISAKAWLSGTAEPSSWSISVGDTSVSAAGICSCTMKNGNAATSAIDYLHRASVRAL